MTTAVEPAQLMTVQHVETLLAVLVSLDSRLTAPDATSAAIRANAWSKLLGEVEPQFALRYAEHAYQQVRDWPLQPAEILQAWRTRVVEGAQRAEQDARQAQGQQQAADASTWRQAQQAGIDYLRALLAADGNMDAVGPPPRVALLTPEQEARERRCRFHQLCACPHDRCRDGWLDAEAVILGHGGRQYPCVQRCSFCHDALLMAEEQGLAVRPGQRGGRRR